MKRNGLVLVTLATVLFTGFVLPRSGWLDAAPAGPVPAKTHRFDPLSTEAACRWRQGQPTHWRACLLQP